MDKIFEKDAERFDKEIQEQEKSFEASGLCIGCGCYVTEAEGSLCEACLLD